MQTNNIGQVEKAMQWSWKDVWCQRHLFLAEVTFCSYQTELGIHNLGISMSIKITLTNYFYKSNTKYDNYKVPLTKFPNQKQRSAVQIYIYKI